MWSAANGTLAIDSETLIAFCITSNDVVVSES